MPDPRFEVGQYVEYVGDDDAASWLWNGHPGVVIDLGSDGGREPVVTFRRGPSLEILDRLVGPLGRDEYEARTSRLDEGLHPVTEHRDVGRGLTAD